MAQFTQDLRFAFRVLRHSPVFTLVAVLSLALGIGANTAIFSVMDALLLRSLPVREPEQLVGFSDGLAAGIFTSDGGPAILFSQPFFQEVRARNRVFSDVAAVESMRADLHVRIGSEGMEPLKARLVSGNYFSLLGVGPAAGRVLTAADDQKPGGHPVAVMSYAFWERRFSRDPGVVGRALALNNTLFTVVGVAAPEFFGTVVGESPDLWIPLAMLQQVQPWFRDPFEPRASSLWLIGRRKPAVSLALAQANAQLIYQQWLRQIAGPSPSPDTLNDIRKSTINMQDASQGNSGLRSAFSRPLQILLVIVGLVLLIACANLANLLLARASGRRRELAVRVALGAGRPRLIGQLLSESLLLALAGGAVGLLLASWGSQFLLAMVSNPQDPIPLEIGPDGRSLLFTFGASLLTGLLFGIAPALRMTRIDVGPALKEGKGTATSQPNSLLGQALVAAQVALALFLLVGAGLFVQTLQKLHQTSAGFDPHHVVRLDLDRNSSTFKGPALLGLNRRIEQRLRTLPGVESASFALFTFGQARWNSSLWPQGVEHTRHNAVIFDGNLVGSQFFESMGMPVRMGRAFGPQDTLHSPRVAVINESMARKLFPETSPLSKHFSLAGDEKPDIEIVGVVADARSRSLREKPEPMFFLYNEQEQDGFNSLVLRVIGPPDTLLSQMRSVIRSEDPNLAISEISTLDEIVERSLKREKMLANLAAFFGLLALLLAAIGLYGVVAYSAARRTNEIGIRMALGASPAEVLAMVLKGSLAAVAVGIAAAIPAILVCGRLVSSQLYGVPPGDPWTIAAAAAFLLAVALIAGFLPARRAALLDPVAALREE